MNKVAKCGDCPYYALSEMFECVGICSLLPGNVTRKDHDRPCGIIRIIMGLPKEFCHAPNLETTE